MALVADARFTALINSQMRYPTGSGVPSDQAVQVI
jgi:hypothetical protein